MTTLAFYCGKPGKWQDVVIRQVTFSMTPEEVDTLFETAKQIGEQP